MEIPLSTHTHTPTCTGTAPCFDLTVPKSGYSTNTEVQDQIHSHLLLVASLVSIGADFPMRLSIYALVSWTNTLVYPVACLLPSDICEAIDVLCLIVQYGPKWHRGSGRRGSFHILPMASPRPSIDHPISHAYFMFRSSTFGNIMYVSQSCPFAVVLFGSCCHCCCCCCCCLLMLVNDR